MRLVEAWSRREHWRGERGKRDKEGQERQEEKREREKREMREKETDKGRERTVRACVRERRWKRGTKRGTKRRERDRERCGALTQVRLLEERAAAVGAAVVRVSVPALVAPEV